MSWTAESRQDLVGAEVFGADGDKVGTVAAVYPGYLVVEKGFFFPTDYYIPMSAVASYDNDQVYLTVPKTRPCSSGWDAQPTRSGDGHAMTTTDEHRHAHRDRDGPPGRGPRGDG